MELNRYSAIPLIILILLAFDAPAQDVPAIPGGVIVWQQVDISSRDTLRGQSSERIIPALDRVKLLGRQPGGNNLKYRVKDANGREWVVKIADESQAEVAANRLLWAIGYRTEVDLIVPRVNIEGVGSFKNARFEARGKDKDLERGERWSWENNQLAGTKEFDGLKIMMALVNNWDLKDDNNTIISENGRSYLVISDLGSSFGKLADKSKSRSGRSVNKPEDFAEAGFVKRVSGDAIVFDYRGMAEDHLKGISVENARWLADLLLQLSDKQISDAFRAANYDNDDVNLLTQAIKERIAALDSATRPVVAETTN